MTGQHRMPASIRRPPPPDRHAHAAPWIAAGAGVTLCLGLFGAAHPVIRPTVDVTAERGPVAMSLPDLPVVTVATEAGTLSAATPSPVPPVHTRRPTTAARPSQTRTAASVATVAPIIATTPATTTAQATAEAMTAAETTTTAATTTATTEPTLLPTPTDVLPTALPVETTSEETP